MQDVLLSRDKYAVQLFTCNNNYRFPSKEKFQFVENMPQQYKPYGGFWTSSYIGENFGSEWVQINLKYDSILVPSSKKWSSYLLYPSSQAKIYTIDSYDDLALLMKKFKQTFKFHRDYPSSKKYYSLNFEKLSLYFDAIHITSKGIAETKNSTPYHMDTWDVESTLWLNFDFFDKVEYIGDINYQLKIESGVM